MAATGFEGYEKRLELHFTSVDDSDAAEPLGLRLLPMPVLNAILSDVQCTIVSATGNRHFDAYVLSESSLFVYPHRLVIKTCGTTQLLNAIPSLLPQALELGLRPVLCRYSRGSFVFPETQPFPHSCFRDEVACLDRLLPAELCHRKAGVISSNIRHRWHVYSASASWAKMQVFDEMTVEVCMTELDRGLARGFYRQPEDCGLSGDEVGEKMTIATGISGILLQSLVCGFAFEPCGYSMNGLDREQYSTIHVTPEDGFSYASFECVDRRLPALANALAKAVRVFMPGHVSVSVCGAKAAVEEEVLEAVATVVKSIGLECQTRAVQDFPGVGPVTYQTFSDRRRWK